MWGGWFAGNIGGLAVNKKYGGFDDIDNAYAGSARNIRRIVNDVRKGSTKRLSAPRQIYDQAVNIAVRDGEISPSKLQHELKVGYARAMRLIDLLEEHNVIERPNVRDHFAKTLPKAEHVRPSDDELRAVL